MGNPRYANGLEVTLRYDLIHSTKDWGKPRRVFMNSMSDLFHEEVPLEFIQAVFSNTQVAEHHTFQVLTKRPEPALELVGYLPWPPKLWMGVSVENPDYLYRADILRLTPINRRGGV